MISTDEFIESIKIKGDKCEFLLANSTIHKLSINQYYIIDGDSLIFPFYIKRNRKTNMKYVLDHGFYIITLGNGSEFCIGFVKDHVQLCDINELKLALYKRNLEKCYNKGAVDDSINQDYWNGHTVLVRSNI